MDWIVIVTGAIFLISVFAGIRKGAVKIAVSLAATVLTFVLVFFLTPYVADAIASLTPLDDMIESQAVSTIGNMIPGGEEEDGGSGSVRFTEEQVRGVMKAAGITEEQLEAAGISVEDIVEGRISKEDLSRYGISGSLLDGEAGREKAEDIVENADIPREVQTAAIENADIPDFLKSLLLSNNNSEIYEKLGAHTFAEYLAKYLTKLIIHILAFILTFLVVTIVLRAIIFALDIVANLPVVGFINRAAGGALGGVGALIIIWILFAVITLLYVTEFGRAAYDSIQSYDILKFIYEYNPVIKLATALR